MNILRQYDRHKAIMKILNSNAVIKIKHKLIENEFKRQKQNCH